MKVFLIAPLTVETRNLPMGLVYTAKALQADGHDVRLLDMCDPAYSSLPTADVASEIQQFGAELIGISLFCARLPETYAFARELKERTGAILLGGGAHAHFAPQEVLEQGFDYVLRGESEPVVGKLATALEQEGDLEAIEGLAYRKDGDIVVNPGHPKADVNTNAAGIPPREIVNTGFETLPNKKPEEMHRNMCIVDSRGCPFPCTFCVMDGVTGKKYRFRSVEDVISEIEFCKKEYGATEFWLSGNSLPADKEWAIAFCRQLIERNINLPWKASANLAHLDEEVLSALEEAKCYVLNVGVETFDPDSIKKTKKPTTQKMIYKKLELMRQYKMGYKPMMMAGFPWETEEHIKSNLDGFKKMMKMFRGKPLNSMFNHPIPFPGSELYKSERDTYGLQDWWLTPAKEEFYSLKFYSKEGKPFFLKDSMYEDDNYLDRFWFWNYSPKIKRALTKAARTGRRLVLKNQMGDRAFARYMCKVWASKFLYAISPKLEFLVFTTLPRSLSPAKR